MVDVPGLDGNGLFGNFLLKVRYARFVLEDGVDEEGGFWEVVYFEKGVGVDGLDDVIDFESW